MHRPRFAFASLATAALALTLAACSPASAGSSPAPSGPVDPNAPRIEAKDIRFLESEVSVPAAKAFTLVFDNQESVPHNVAIVDAADKAVFTGDVVTGPTSRPYAVPALAAGTYHFICSIHPDMKGTLTAK